MRAAEKPLAPGLRRVLINTSPNRYWDALTAHTLRSHRHVNMSARTQTRAAPVSCGA